MGVLCYLDNLKTLGIVNKSVKPGNDEVWLLEGGRTPFLLRRIHGSHEYKFLGEAYIHGIMHGEYIQGLGSNIHWQDVWLS